MLWGGSDEDLDFPQQLLKLSFTVLTFPKDFFLVKKVPSQFFIDKCKKVKPLLSRGLANKEE